MATSSRRSSARAPRQAASSWSCRTSRRKAARRIAAEGLGDRARVVGGDIFREIPTGGDTYVLSHAVHDWDAKRLDALFTSLRRATRPGTRLHIIEALASGQTAVPARVLDLMMLVGTGGQERTEEEYRDLLAAHGFTQTRVLQTGTSACIIEAVRA